MQGLPKIAHELMEEIYCRRLDRGSGLLIYNEFKSVLSQQVVIKQVLPISTEAFAGESGKPESEDQVDYLYEQLLRKS